MRPHPDPAAHLAPDELRAYVTRTLDEGATDRVERHLGTCDECGALALELRLMDNALRNWSARGYDEAYRRESLAAALADAESAASDDSLRERLRRWREQWAGRAETAVGVLVEVGEKRSRLFTEGLEALVRPGGPAFELVPVGGVRARGDGGTAGRPTEVGSGASVAVARTLEGVETTTEIDEDTRELYVRIRGWDPDRRPPLVLLRKDRTCIAVMTPQLVAGALVARFPSVGQGAYVVQIEPGEVVS